MTEDVSKGGEEQLEDRKAIWQQTGEKLLYLSGYKTSVWNTPGC